MWPESTSQFHLSNLLKDGEKDLVVLMIPHRCFSEGGLGQPGPHQEDHGSYDSHCPRDAKTLFGEGCSVCCSPVLGAKFDWRSTSLPELVSALRSVSLQKGLPKRYLAVFFKGQGDTIEHPVLKKG